MEILENQGLTLNEYCEVNDLSPARVWQKIRQGELVSRTVSGRLRIFGADDHSELSPRLIGATAKDEASLADLPSPLPFENDNDSKDLDKDRTSQVSIYEPEATSEVALLIDHLSLAKEENKEILRMSRASIAKITEMSEQILESKEQVIDAHKQTIQEKNLIIEVQQEKIDTLREKLRHKTNASDKKNTSGEELKAQREMFQDIIASKEQLIDELSDKIETLEKTTLKLRQDYEDLEILARTLADGQSFQ